MKTSKQGIDFIMSFEKFRANAYLCEAGVLTIGYGHTRGVRLGDFCTMEQAEQMLAEDIELAENSVNKLSNLNLKQNQFDALVSFAFNCGVHAFETSTLRKLILNNPADPNIKAEFNKWVWSKKKKSKGLMRRRNEEYRMYNS